MDGSSSVRPVPTQEQDLGLRSRECRPYTGAHENPPDLRSTQTHRAGGGCFPLGSRYLPGTPQQRICISGGFPFKCSLAKSPSKAAGDSCKALGNMLITGKECSISMAGAPVIPSLPSRHHQRHFHEKGSFVSPLCSCCLFLHLKSGSEVWDPSRHLHSNPEQGLGQGAPVTPGSGTIRNGIH